MDRPWTRGFAAPLLLAAVVAWALLARPEAGIGTMGMARADYLVMWTGMTAAMMLSPLAWFASGYAAAIRRGGGTTLVHVARTSSLVCGYALVWVLAGLVALLLAAAIDELAARWPAAVPWAGSAALLVAGGYQLSGLKARCLATCRSPLSFALAAARLRGPLRDARVGVLHGGWCVACCWHLMAALIAVGTMDLRWTAGLAVLILVERAWRRSGPLVRASGFALLVAGCLAPWVPAVAPALHELGMS